MKASTEKPDDGEKAAPTNVPDFKVVQFLKTPHNARLYEEVQRLKSMINALVDYQLAHPKPASPTGTTTNTTPTTATPATPTARAAQESEQKISCEIERQEKYIRAQLSIVKTLYRKSVLKVREEKAKTSDARGVNDALILGLHNLKYEEQSLRTEIMAAEKYDHKYMKLPLIPLEEFLALFPEHENSSDHELMTARIEHEHQLRLKLEERRQEKLKQKQKLIAEVKKGKDALTKLDAMVEKFVEDAEPIRQVLAAE